MIQENKIKREKERAARLDSAGLGQPRPPMHALGHNLAREKPDPFCLFIIFYFIRTFIVQILFYI